jgi:catecholate siderophore receptor
VSKTPHAQEFTSIRVGGGSADYKRTTLDTNQRVNNSVAFRFNACGRTPDSRSRRCEVQELGLAPSLLLGMGKPTQLTMNFSHMQQNNIPDFGLPTLLPDTAINAASRSTISTSATSTASRRATTRTRPRISGR